MAGQKAGWAKQFGALGPLRLFAQIGQEEEREKQEDDSEDQIAGPAIALKQFLQGFDVCHGHRAPTGGSALTLPQC